MIGIFTELCEVLAVCRRDIPLLVLDILNSRRLYRSGQWCPIHDNPEWAGRAFCVLTSPVVGILWAWNREIRASTETPEERL